MKVLLLSMPDTADFFDHVMTLPSLGLVSLAGNLPGHDVRVLDLVLLKPRIRERLRRMVEEFQPDLVGLSAMTFQFDSLLRVARLIRAWAPRARIAAGGYHVTLLADDLTRDGAALPIDFLVRGEGELTFAGLVAELGGRDPDLGAVTGLSYRDGDGWVHNPARALADLDALELPRRGVRSMSGYRIYDVPTDVAETSRGCLHSCTFCSITRMYGHRFRARSVDRVAEDLERTRARGAKWIFLVDDNIASDVGHLRGVCEAIIQHRLNDVLYIVQIGSATIARHPDLPALMRRANIRIAFVGFESMLPDALRETHKPATLETNMAAARLLHEQGIAIVAACVLGYPDDSQRSIRESMRRIRALRPDGLLAQYLTPYPGTEVRAELLAKGLVANTDDYRQYDGLTCNIRTKHLGVDELYRCVKREAMKFIFDPRLVASNYFLREHFVPFLRAEVRILATNAYNVLTARQVVARSDL